MEILDLWKDVEETVEGSGVIVIEKDPRERCRRIDQVVVGGTDGDQRGPLIGKVFYLRVT